MQTYYEEPQIGAQVKVVLQHGHKFACDGRCIAVDAQEEDQMQEENVQAQVYVYDRERRFKSTQETQA